jgi:hypothetical protein
VKRTQPTKRVRLAAAVREAMAPFMRAHGFDHPPKTAYSYTNQYPRVDHWYRWVGDERQCLALVWANYTAPRFSIEWWDDSKLVGGRHMPRFYLRPWRLRFMGRTLYGGCFGGLWPISTTVRRAMKRFEELLNHWDTGEASPNLGLDARYVSSSDFMEWQPDRPKLQQPK